MQSTITIYIEAQDQFFCLLFSSLKSIARTQETYYSVFVCVPLQCDDFVAVWVFLFFCFIIYLFFLFHFVTLRSKFTTKWWLNTVLFVCEKEAFEENFQRKNLVIIKINILLLRSCKYRRCLLHIQRNTFCVFISSQYKVFLVYFFLKNKMIIHVTSRK